MTLLLVALLWFLFALAAGALVGKCMSLLHPEEQEGTKDAGAQVHGDTYLRSQFFGPSEDWMAPFDRELAEVVELDARRIRRANRGSVA